MDHSTVLDKDVIYDELFEIWAKRIKTKHYTIEAFEFERNAGAEMLKQARKLADLTWEPSGFRKFRIHQPEREINAPLYPDRISEAWITEKYIKEYVSPKVLYTNMACQSGKGMKAAMHLLKNALADCFRKWGFDFYFFQYDMQGYYNNLSHDKIKEQYSGLPASGYKLLCNIVDSWECKDEYAALEDPFHKYGVPKGNLPSQWIGVLYLNELDHLINEMEECQFFVRYMDDAIMLFHTKRDCRKAYRFIEDYLSQNHMGIRMHPQKSNYAPITRGFNFCGWHYEMKESGKILMHIRQSKKKQMIGKLKYISGRYERGEIAWIEACDVLRGMCNYLKWGDTYHLRKYLCNRFHFQRKTDFEMNLEEPVYDYTGITDFDLISPDEYISLMDL